MSRIGLIKSWSPYASLLKKISDPFRSLGTDEGGMVMTATGTGLNGESKKEEWHIYAGSCHGNLSYY